MKHPCPLLLTLFVLAWTAGPAAAEPWERVLRGRLDGATVQARVDLFRGEATVEGPAGRYHGFLLGHHGRTMPVFALRGPRGELKFTFDPRSRFVSGRFYRGEVAVGSFYERLDRRAPSAAPLRGSVQEQLAELDRRRAAQRAAVGQRFRALGQELSDAVEDLGRAMADARDGHEELAAAADQAVADYAERQVNAAEATYEPRVVDPRERARGGLSRNRVRAQRQLEAELDRLRKRASPSELEEIEALRERWRGELRQELAAYREGDLTRLVKLLSPRQSEPLAQRAKRAPSQGTVAAPQRQGAAQRLRPSQGR